MDGMTIGEVAQWANVQTSTLRYYESIGLLPRPRRVSGRRLYSAEVLPILAVIQLAKDAQFTLEEIQQLFHGFSPDLPLSERWKALVKQKITEVDAQISRVMETKRLLEEALECPFLLNELDESQFLK